MIFDFASGIIAVLVWAVGSACTQQIWEDELGVEYASIRDRVNMNLFWPLFAVALIGVLLANAFLDDT